MINNNHPIVVSGLQDIQSWLDQNGSLLGGLRSDKNSSWRFIFVVSSQMASTFKLQKLKGDTLMYEWAVLGLEEQIIFRRRRRPDSSVRHIIISQQEEQQMDVDDT